MANDINLAALWVPVMPETKGLGPAMKTAGETAKKEFVQGFQSGGGGTSPEQMGAQWGQQFIRSLSAQMSNLRMPDTMQNFVGSLGEKTKATEHQLDSLKAKVQSTYTEWQRATAQAAPHQEKLVALQKQYNDAIASGNTKFASFVQSRMQFHQQHPDMEKAVSAQNKYTDATGKLSAAQGAVTKSSTLMSAAMGAGVGIAASLAISGIQSLMSAMWDMVKGAMTAAIDTAKALAQEIIHVGETYEGLANQVELYSGMQGQALEDLKASTADVYGGLDTDAKDLGKTMATLSTTLGLQGEPLEQLGSHVAMLQGRFGQFNVGNFTAAMASFNVEGAQADTLLANLTQQAQTGAISLDDITSALARNGAILQEAGLNINQSAAFISNLGAEGLPVASVLANLTTAQGKFNDAGLTMQEGLKLTKQRLDEYRAAGDKLNEKALLVDVFGESGWANAPQLLEAMASAASMTADEFDANGQSLDQLQEHTQGLAEKWTEVKHQAEEALRPMGEAAVGVIGSALDKLSGYVKEHHDQIMHWVTNIGVQFIALLPSIQGFVAGALDILAPFAEGTIEVFGAITGSIGSFLLAMGEATRWIPGMGEMSEGLRDAGSAAMDMGIKMHDLNVGKGMRDAADWVRSFNIDVPKMVDGWVDFAKEVDDTTFDDKEVNVGIGNSLGQTTNFGSLPGGPTGNADSTSVFGPALAGTGAPGTSSGPGNSQGPVGLPGMMIPGGGGNSGDLDSALAASGAPAELIRLIKGFSDVEGKNPAGNPTLGFTDSQLGGASDVGSHVAALMKQFKDRSGVAGPFPAGGGDAAQAAWIAKVVGQAGLSSDWEGNAQPGDYVQRVIAAMQKYQSGGSIEGQGFPGFAPNSRDTIPIWAEGGEEIINKESSAKYRQLIKLINADAFQGGGQVGVQQVIWANPLSGSKIGEAGGKLVGPGTGQSGYYSGDWGGHTGHVHTSFFTAPDGSPYGLPTGTDIRQGASGFPAWVYELGDQYGVEGSTYSGHQEKSGYNRGIDWWPKGKADMSGASYTPAEVQALDTFAGAMASAGAPTAQVDASGHVTNDGTGEAPSAWGAYAGGGQFTAGTGTYGGSGGSGGSSGGSSGSFGSSGPGGKNIIMTAQGPMEAEDWESKARNDAAVRDQRQRLDDMDADIQQRKRDIEDQKRKLDAMLADLDPLTKKPKATQDQIDSATQALADARTDLAKQERERGDEQTELGTKERKAAEDALGKPVKGGDKRRDATGMEAFQDLGGGLMSGLADSLGLGTIFDKPPWEWGIFKLATGLANFGFGTMEAWSNEVGKGHTGVTGFQALPGFEEGAQGGGGMNIGGLNIPSIASLAPNVSNGPNIGVNAVPSIGFGQQLGPAPGPVTNDNSLVVNQNGMQRTDVEGMQHAQNARGTVDVQTGNMPKP